MIELHAKFLELNFLSQIRAIPNVGYKVNGIINHPLTLHLSPTSHVNVVVTSINPLPPPSSKFVLIAPDSEVIVTPKTRQPSDLSKKQRSESILSGGQPSVSGRSAVSATSQKGERSKVQQEPFFVRLVNRSVAKTLFDGDQRNTDKGIKIWMSPKAIFRRQFRFKKYVSVSIVKPYGLDMLFSNPNIRDGKTCTSTVVAELEIWDNAPNEFHACLSSLLCQTLGYSQVMGEIAKVGIAPQPGIKDPVTGKRYRSKLIQVYPFSTPKLDNKGVLSLRGKQTKSDDASQELRKGFQAFENQYDILRGPLTHEMILPSSLDLDMPWPGGFLKFKDASSQVHPSNTQPIWMSGKEERFNVEFQTAIPLQSTPPSLLSTSDTVSKPLSPIIGVEGLFSQLSLQLPHCTSTLLTGGLGVGKTALACNLGHQYYREYLARTTYFQCRILSSEETRLSEIKDKIKRIFASAVWATRFGGRAMVILDDLDWLCPAENELQIGNDNNRNKQVAESLCAIVRKYCSVDSRVMFLATAQSKDALHQVIIGGHVLHNIIPIKQPDKESRRRILEHLLPVQVWSKNRDLTAQYTSVQAEPINDFLGSENSVTNGEYRKCENIGQMKVGEDVDFLNIAGLCDGFMPGDIVLLISRIQNEAIIRSSNDHPEGDPYGTITIMNQDISKAMQGFIPASLRNVPLQSSVTQWDDIGGLKTTRQILLETLQYPTTYAPIFANCPLRLRSGLLLYGYPGCGKTLLASAVAGECGLNFISVRGPEILNKYIGASEKAVRDLFGRAESAKPCVLFFDEFDSIAPKRGHDSTGVTDRVVNQLLTQMDGAEGLTGVYVLAATSRPDLIDPALLRPGRLDKSLLCDMPSIEDRVQILRALCKKVRLDKAIRYEEEAVFDIYDVKQNISTIASRTEGYSGADLHAVIYNAQLAAIQEALDEELPDEYRVDVSMNQFSGMNHIKFENEGSKYAYDFTHFLYEDSPRQLSTRTAQGARANERAEIVAKLDALQLQHSQHRVTIAAKSGSVTEVETQEDKACKSDEPVTCWRHIEEALWKTKPSIAESERRRLQQIYHKFVVGRNGELPNGQGGNEIGGRTSLM